MPVSAYVIKVIIITQRQVELAVTYFTQLSEEQCVELAHLSHKINMIEK